MGSFAGSLKDLYFFVALAGKVQVLHGWKVLVGLIGDCHLTEGGNVSQPALWVTNGNQSDQWKNFSKETVPAR